VLVMTGSDLKKSVGTTIHNSQWFAMPTLNFHNRLKNKHIVVWTTQDTKLAQTSLSSKCYVLRIVCGML
jgi:hypothetical protein